MSTPITHVSDTARWVAIYRAMETDRPDALFRDPHARRLAGEQGEAIVLARDLGARPGMRYWLTDLGSPMLQKLLQRQWGSQLAASPFQFFPEEGTAFFDPFGWREVEVPSTWDEAFRLKRTMRFGRLWKLLSMLSSKARYEAGRRMSGQVLLGRT